MSWSFETDSDFQAQLDWIDTFTREEIEPLDLVFRGPGDPWDPASPAARAMAPLKQIAKDKRLWACHLGPELGGQGYGQVKLGLMNEILGRSRFGPSVFGCQAPDSGNAEILAHFGTPQQKKKFLQPLLDGNIASCYSMTEPQAGADPSSQPARSVPHLHLPLLRLLFLFFLFLCVFLAIVFTIHFKCLLYIGRHSGTEIEHTLNDRTMMLPGNCPRSTSSAPSK